LRLWTTDILCDRERDVEVLIEAGSEEAHRTIGSKVLERKLFLSEKISPILIYFNLFLFITAKEYGL
jgi:hypothetical protein